MFYSDPAFTEGGCEVGTPLLLAGALQRTGKECLPRRAGSAPRTDLCCAVAITLPEESKSQRPRQLTPALLAHHCSLIVLNTIWEMALNNPCPFLQGVPQPSVPAHPHRGQPGPLSHPAPGCFRRAPPPLQNYHLVVSQPLSEQTNELISKFSPVAKANSS